MVPRTISLDVEASKIPRHYPWIEGSFLVDVGITDQLGFKKTWTIRGDNRVPVDLAKSEIQAEISRSTRLVGHNLKFDLSWLNWLGIDYSHCKLWCTQVADYLINGQQRIGYSLDEVCKRRGIRQKIDKMKVYWAAGYETDEIPLHIRIPYLEQDCYNALAVFQQQAEDVNKWELHSIIALQMEMVGVLSKIESNGMFVDPARMDKFIGILRDALAYTEFELLDLLGHKINLSSNDELSAALFGGVLKHEGVEPVMYTKKAKLREPYVFRYKSGREVIKHRTRSVDMLTTRTRKTIIEKEIPGAGFKPAPHSETKKEGYYKVNKDALAQIKARSKKQVRIKELLDERSKTAKALETLIGKSEGKGLINKIRPDGCIHGNFNQTITQTGRLSSSNPNMQNLARSKTSPIKKIFIPRHTEHVILNADLSQLEWRVAACLAQDKVAIDEIIRDVDYHSDNAIKFFKANPNSPEFDSIRTMAKVLGFRLLYGGSEYGFFNDSKMPNYTMQQWKDLISEYWEKYNGIKAWQDENINRVFKEGFLRLPSGRILRFPPGNRGEEYSITAIKNYPVQSFATADIMPLAMCVIDKRMVDYRFNAKLICQVHDSIVFDCPKEEINDLSNMCVGVFEELPGIIRAFWGYDFNIPLTGEVEYGPSYGETLYKGKGYPVEWKEM